MKNSCISSWLSLGDSKHFCPLGQHGFFVVVDKQRERPTGREVDVIHKEAKERDFRDVVRSVEQARPDIPNLLYTNTWYRCSMEGAAEQDEKSLILARALLMGTRDEGVEHVVESGAMALRTLAVREMILYMEFAHDRTVPPLPNVISAPLNDEQMERLFQELKRRGAFEDAMPFPSCRYPPADSFLTRSFLRIARHVSAIFPPLALSFLFLLFFLFFFGFSLEISNADLEKITRVETFDRRADAGCVAPVPECWRMLYIVHEMEYCGLQRTAFRLRRRTIVVVVVVVVMVDWWNVTWRILKLSALDLYSLEGPYFASAFPCGIAPSLVINHAFTPPPLCHQLLCSITFVFHSKIKFDMCRKRKTSCRSYFPSVSLGQNKLHVVR